MKQSGDSIRVVHPLFQKEDDGSTPISPLQLEIQKMPLDQAVALNKVWHSSQPNIGNAGQGCFAYGAFYKNRFYAVAIWGHPLARKLNGKNILEMRRMAIANDAPKNTGSRMLKIMRILIKDEHGKICKLISYQDTDVHNGPLYKSAGWIGTEVSIPAKGWDSRIRDRSKPNPDKTRSIKIRWEFNL